MAKLELIATSTFGLEAVVKREVEALGYKILQSENGKISFLGDERAVAKANIWLRCADRVQIKLAEFEAKTFTELFEQTKALPWEQWIPMDGQINVSGSSVKSQLHSVPACQGMVKKAIIEKLKETYFIEEFPETGLPFALKVTILKDRVTLTLDTTGETPNFGTKVGESAEFAAQFIGKTGPFTLGAGVDGISGATITSEAAVEAINNAIK